MKDIKIRQLCFFFIAFLPVTKVFLLPSVLAGISKNDMWISLALSLTLDLLTLVAIIFILKKFPSQSFYEILENRLGTVSTKIIFSFYVIIFFVKAYLPIVEQRNFVELTLYETKPTIFTFLPFFAISFYLSLKSKLAIARISDIMAFVTFFSFLLIFALSFNSSDVTMILPLGINGVSKIAFGAYSAFPWLNDSIYLLFLLGKIKYEKGTFWKIITGFLIGSAIVLFFNILFYGAFSDIAERQEFALTEISKYSAIISVVGRFDYVAIFMILFSSSIALCLPLYFATECLNLVCEFKVKLIPSLIINGTSLILMIVLSPYIISVQNFIERYFSAFFIFFCNILPCFTLILKKENNYEKKQTIKC